MVLKEWDSGRWKRFFRVDKKRFWKVERDLSPMLAGVGCNVKEPLSVEYKVAAYFLRMSTGASFSLISELLDIGVSTASWHCWKVPEAIVHVYGHLISASRYERSLGAIQEQFRTSVGWQGAVGAIDCTHIKVKKPGGAHGRWWRNRNSQFSSIVQAVRAPDLKFHDGFLGFPGSAHDQHVFAESPLGVAFRAGTHPIQLQAPIPCRRTSIHPYLLGDSGYKALTDLVIPYSSSEEGRD